MLSHPAIDEVRTNVGMPMEFDPRQGEVPKPDGIEFTLPNDEDLSILRLIDEVCEKHDLKVRLPDFKQPDFTYTSHKGETRAPNKNADYDAFVRLVDDD